MINFIWNDKSIAYFKFSKLYTCYYKCNFGLFWSYVKLNLANLWFPLPVYPLQTSTKCQFCLNCKVNLIKIHKCK